jgi:hypothetical protein
MYVPLLDRHDRQRCEYALTASRLSQLSCLRTLLSDLFSSVQLVF